MAERLPETDARQGAKGKPMLYVLLASLLLIAVAAAGLLTWNGAKSPNDYAAKSTDAMRQETTGSVTGSKTTAPAATGTTGNPQSPPPASDKPNP